MQELSLGKMSDSQKNPYKPGRFAVSHKDAPYAPEPKIHKEPYTLLSMSFSIIPI